MIIKFVLILIEVYKKFISPALPHSCRYYPSCSEYLYQAVSKFGVFRGLFYGFKRILRCSQYSTGGFDPL